MDTTDTAVKAAKQQGRVEAWEEMLLAFAPGQRRQIANMLAHGWVITDISVQQPSYYHLGDKKMLRVNDEPYSQLKAFLPFTDGPIQYKGISLPARPEGGKKWDEV